MLPVAGGPEEELDTSASERSALEWSLLVVWPLALLTVVL